MAYEYMTPAEKAAYLQGLAEGLDLDKSKPEGKLIDAILDLLYDITDGMNDLEERVDQIEDEYYEDDFDDDFYEDNLDYEVICPDCGAEVVVDEDTLIEGEINCPNCGGVLEFDFSSLFDADKDESEDLPF